MPQRAVLHGCAAIVTGAGRGIGAAVARRLAADGASVVVNDLDAAEARDVVQSIVDAGGRAAALAGSVVEADFGASAVALCLERFGTLDIVVNNAGYTWDGALHKMSDEQWQAMLDVHLTAPFRLLRAAYAAFKAQHQRDLEAGRLRHRKVVNVSSIVGLGGNGGQANYAAAKAGIVGLTKSLAKEWGRLAVNVNCVAFGHIETRLTQPRGGQPQAVTIDGREITLGVGREMLDMVQRQIPLGRAGSPAEAADAIAMFCRPESDYVSGQVLVCGGGLALG